MLLELNLLVSLSTGYFTMCPSLVSTTLLSCDFVCSLERGCQTFLLYQENNGFTLILVLLYQGQSLRLLCSCLQARLTAINQKHSYSASCQAYLDGYMGFDVRVFCVAFPPASLGRHIKMENSLTLEAFNQLKIL